MTKDKQKIIEYEAGIKTLRLWLAEAVEVLENYSTLPKKAAFYEIIRSILEETEIN